MRANGTKFSLGIAFPKGRGLQESFNPLPFGKAMPTTGFNAVSPDFYHGQVSSGAIDPSGLLSVKQAIEGNGLCTHDGLSGYSLMDYAHLRETDGV